MDAGVIVGIIGVVVAVVIGVWQIRAASDRRESEKKHLLPEMSEAHSASSKKPHENHPARTHSTKLLPEDIIGQIDSLPLLQQDRARESYLGLRVKWHVAVKFMSAAKDGLTLLSTQDRGHYPWVYFEADLSGHPEIALAKSGQLLWVAGTIADVGSNTITLDDVALGDAPHSETA